MRKIISMLLVVLLVVQVCFFSGNSVLAASVLSTPTITSPRDGSELSKGAITVKWGSVSGSDYYLFAALDTTTGSKFINNLKVTGTSYSISSGNLTEGHEYKIAVGAYKNNGDASNWAVSYFSISKPASSAKYKIYGYIKDSAGSKGIANAVVTLDNKSSLRATTDSNGYYSLSGIEKGTHSISTEASGYQSSITDVTISGSDVKKDINLTKAEQKPSMSNFTLSKNSIKIGDTLSFSGTVNGNGGIIEKVTVNIKGPDNKSFGAQYTTLSPNAGNYNMSSIPALKSNSTWMTKAGTYWVEVWAKNAGGNALIVSEAKVTVTPDTSITISGVVKNKYTGAYIPEVKAILNNDPNWSKPTDSNGYFVFNGVANGTHDLSIVRDKYVFVNERNEQIAKVPVTISNKSAQQQTLYMIDVNGKYEIYGTLRDVNNKPIAGAFVYPDSASSKNVFGVTTKADGSYRLIGISNGYHTLNVDLQGYIPIEGKNVTVSNRNVKQDLVLLSKRIVDGYVSEVNFFGEASNTKVKDAKVWLDKGGDAWTKVTLSSGTFDFNGVSSENHYISASAAGYEPKTNVVVDLTKGNKTYVFALTKLENIPKDKETVLAAYKNGLLTGSTKSSFSSKITRAEFSELINVFLTKLQGKSSNVSQVPNYSLYRYDNTSISRQELALMLYKTITLAVPGASGKDLKLQFTDMSRATGEPRDAVAFLETNGIMLGEGNGTFSPNGYVTKEQAVVIIERAFEKTKKISGEYSKKEKNFTDLVNVLRSQSFLSKQTNYKKYTVEVAQKAVDGPLFRVADDLASLSFSTIYSNITEPAYAAAEDVFIDYAKQRNAFYADHPDAEPDFSVYSNEKNALDYIKKVYDLIPALKTNLSDNDILELKKLLLSDDLRQYNNGGNIKNLAEKYSKYFVDQPNQGILSNFKKLYQSKNINQSQMLKESRTMLNMDLPDKAKSSLLGKVFNGIDNTCFALDTAIEVCALVSIQEKAVQDLKDLKNYINEPKLKTKIDNAIFKLENEYIAVLQKVVKKYLDDNGAKIVEFSISRLASGTIASEVMTGLQIGSMLSNLTMNADTVLNKDKCIVTNLMIQNDMVKSFQTEFNNIKSSGNSIDKIKLVQKGLIGFSTLNELGTKYAYELLEAHDTGLLQNTAMFFGGNYDMDKQKSKNYINLMKSEYEKMLKDTKGVYEAY